MVTYYRPNFLLLLHKAHFVVTILKFLSKIYMWSVYVEKTWYLGQIVTLTKLSKKSEQTELLLRHDLEFLQQSQNRHI